MTAFIALALIAQQPAEAPKASELFNKMLNKYYTAKTIKGTIQFNQTAVETGTKVTITTSLQAMKPNLFIVEQNRSPQSADPALLNQFLAISDGTNMAYSVPKGALPWTDYSSGKHSRFYEKAPKTISEALDAFCTFTLDRSLPLALALYNPYEVERVTKKLSNLQVLDEVETSGKKAYRIQAAYTFAEAVPEKNIAAIRIPAYIFIDKEYNLVGLVWQETVVDGGVKLILNNQWVVDLQPDAEVDKNQFRVR